MVKSELTKRQRLFLVAGEWALLGASAVILLVFLASSLDGLVIKNGGEAAVISAILVDLANTDRGTNQVPELATSPVLTAIAQAKANDMATNGYFAHTSPSGQSPWYWFQQGGYIFSYAGENLAVDFSDSADVELAWMNSPEHRANLLNGHFTEIGVATAVGQYEGRTTTFVVQEFGTPAPTRLTSTPVVQPTKPKPKTSSVAAVKPSAPAKIALAAPKPLPEPILSLDIATTSDLVDSSTSTNQVLAASAGAVAAPPASTEGLQAIWNVFAASPKTTLRYAYYLFGILILIALIIETGIEIRRHHIRHMSLALTLLVLMAVLFFVADRYVFTTPQIESAASATG